MPISILAIRCRFCGAEVGRPRKEQETFTVKDLGGEQRSAYTLSGNVTEALEAFISEERAQLDTKERQRQAATQKSFFRRKSSGPSQSAAPPAPTAGLPELDSVGRDLASVQTSSTRPNTARLGPGSLLETVGRKTLVAAALIAGLILLYFGTDFAWARIRHLIGSSSTEDSFVYPNRAEEYYSSGMPLVEVLEEALTALDYNNTEENVSIAEKMRKRFIEDIEGKAFANPFDINKLNAASKDVSRAGQKDRDARVRALMDEVAREVGFFKFILTNVESDESAASFRLNNPFFSKKDETVVVGDMLQDRFLVKSIKATVVHLEDTSPRGSGRQLVARKLEQVEALR